MMARTYPLTVPYNQCLGACADRLSFASLCLEDLRNGQSQCLSTLKQLVDALPKTENPCSLYALNGHIARPGQKRLRHSMRAAIWWLQPPMESFASLPTPSSIISHARDGVWSCEGVM